MMFFHFMIRYGSLMRFWCFFVSKKLPDSSVSSQSSVVFSGRVILDGLVVRVLACSAGGAGFNLQSEMIY